MGKKNKTATGLGRSLIKDRFGSHKGRKLAGDSSMLHTTEVQDGYEWGRLNLKSVTEESSFQEFLSTAELAGTEFQAEKLNIKFVNPSSNVGLLTKDQKRVAEASHVQYKDLLKIPRRPPWNSQTTVEELHEKEKENSLEWRRALAKLQEEEGLLLTPYEKNLEFWRQLWRVIERSDIIVQIVDARNPILFRCEDLENYVKEVSKNKINMILLNKADFLTKEQRECWAHYFTNIGVKVAFFSAISHDEKEEKNLDVDFEKAEETIDKTNTDDLKESVDSLEKAVDETAEKLANLTRKVEEMVANEEVVLNKEKKLEKDKVDINNSSDLLSREDLIELFRKLHKNPKVTENIVTVGLVGYPNVGKSSTINSLLTYKKVSVSATPGKTKHFQTLFLDKDILLCDCPGLVMPSFVFTKADMILNGILPIDQMRDHVPPINLVCNLIPKHILEDKYGIMLPLPMEGEDPDRCPTYEELLNAYAYNRGFMTANGQPDNPRAARYILKDFINGRLLYAHAPPGISQNEYHTWPLRKKVISANRVATPREIRAVKGVQITSYEFDKTFFSTKSHGVHAKGISGKAPGLPVNMKLNAQSTEGAVIEKPWKKIHKHENKKKKEKLRRVYAHLDQH